MTALKVVGMILFYGMGLILLVFSLMFYYALWGVGGLVGAFILFPLVEIYPIVVWIMTGIFPGLLFAIWGVGIVGGILMGVASKND